MAITKHQATALLMLLATKSRLAEGLNNKIQFEAAHSTAASLDNVFGFLKGKLTAAPYNLLPADIDHLRPALQNLWANGTVIQPALNRDVHAISVAFAETLDYDTPPCPDDTAALAVWNALNN